MAQAFNFSLQMNLQAPKGLGSVRNDIERSLKGIKVPIEITVSPDSLRQIQSLNREIQSLQQSIRNISKEGYNVSNLFNNIGSSYSNVANQGRRLNSVYGQLSSSTRRIRIETAEAHDAMEQFGRVTGLSARRFSGFLVAAGSIFSLVNSIKTATKEGLDFERQMVRLAQVGGSTVAEIREVEREITRLSTGLGVSSKELAHVSVMFRQAGLSMQDTKTALAAIAKSSLAPDFDSMSSSAEAAIATFQQFGVQARDLDSVFSSINTVAANFAVESRDITEGIKRAGGAFRVAGGDLKQFVSLLTSIRSATRESAETISTGMRTIFTRLQRSSTVDALHQLGVELRFTRQEARQMGDMGLERQFVGPYQAIQRIGAALKNIRTTDPRYSSIIEQLGGYRQVSRVVPLLQNAAEAQRAYNAATLGSVPLTDIAAKAQDALLVRLEGLRQKFLALFRTITESSGFQNFANRLIQIGEKAIQLADKLTPLIPLLGALTAAKLGQGIISFANNSGFFSGVGQGLTGRGPRRLATGGTVGGSGAGDHIPALLEPGEFVINKRAAQAIGYDALHGFNTGRVRRFADGGQAGGGQPTNYNNALNQLMMDIQGGGRSSKARQIFDLYEKANALSRGNFKGDNAFYRGLEKAQKWYKPDPTSKIPDEQRFVMFARRIIHNELLGAYTKVKDNKRTVSLNTDLSENFEGLTHEELSNYSPVLSMQTTNKKRDKLKRTQIQDVAKKLGIRANQSNAKIFAALREIDPESKKGIVEGAVNSVIGGESLPTEEPVTPPIKRTRGRPRKNTTVTVPALPVPTPPIPVPPAQPQPVSDWRPNRTNALVPVRTVVPEVLDEYGNVIPSKFDKNSYYPPYVKPSLSPPSGPRAPLMLPPPPKSPSVGTGENGPNDDWRRRMEAIYGPNGVRKTEFPFVPEGMRYAAKYGRGVDKSAEEKAISDAHYRAEAEAMGERVRYPRYALGPRMSREEREERRYALNQLPVVPPAELEAIENRKLQYHSSTISGFADEAANRRMRGASHLFSQETRDSISNKERVRIEKDLIHAEAELLKKIYPQIKSSEAYKIAQENVIKAFDELSPVVRNARNNMVGTERTVGLAKEYGIDVTPSRSLGLRGRLGSAVRGIGTRIGEGLKDHWQMGLMVAAPLIAEGADHLAGTAEQAVSGRNEASFTRNRGASGALVGASTGAAIGSIAGPWGAAAGALIGGIWGLVNGIKDAEKSLREVKFNEAGKNLSEALARIAIHPDTPASPLESRRVLESLNIRLKSKEDEARANSTHFFSGLNVEEYLNSARRGRNEALSGGGFAEIVNLLSREAVRTGRNNFRSITRTNTPEELNNEVNRLLTVFQNGNHGLNRVSLERVAETRNMPVREVVEQFREQIINSARTARIEEGQTQNRTAVEATINSFDRLVMAINNATVVMNQLETQSKGMAGLFSGQLTATHVSGLSNSLSAEGSIYSGAVRGITSPFGSQGVALTNTALAASQVRTALPAAIASALSSAAFTPDNMSSVIRQSLTHQLGGENAVNGNSALARAIQVVTNNLDRMKPEDVQREARVGDTTKLVEQLLKDFEPVNRVLQHLASNLEQEANSLIEGLTENQRRLHTLNQEQLRGDKIKLSGQMFDAQLRAQQAGRRYSPLEFISLRQQEGHFNNNIQRLAGTQNVDEIIAKLNLVTNRIRAGERFQQQAHINGDRESFVRTANGLSSLRGQAHNLQEALRNLTDVSQRASAAQQRLSEIEQERQSRLSFGEQFIMADPAQKMMMARGMSLVGVAARQGHLNNFTQPDKRLILETLRSLGSTKLNGLGGIKANELRERLVENAGFKQDKSQKEEKKSLEDTITRYYADANKAQAGLITQQKTLQENLFERLGEIHQNFFNQLKVHNLEEERRRTVVRATQVSNDIQGYRQQSQHRETLRGLGINNDEQLRPYRDNVSHIESFIRARGRVFSSQQNGGAALSNDNLGTIFNNIFGGRPNSRIFAINDRNRTQFAERLTSTFNFSNAAATRAVARFEALLDQIPHGGQHDLPVGERRNDIINAIRQGILEGANHNLNEARTNETNARNALTSNGFSAEAVNRIISVLGANNAGAPRLLGAINAFDGSSPARRLTGFDDALRQATTQLGNLNTVIQNLTGQIGEATPTTHRTTRAPEGATRGFARGGAARGSDIVPAMLTPGEFIVSRDNARRHLGLLEHINQGGNPGDILHAAVGGQVGQRHITIGSGRRYLTQVHEGRLNPFIQALVHQMTRNHHMSRESALMAIRAFGPMNVVHILQAHAMQQNSGINAIGAALVRDRGRAGQPRGEYTVLGGGQPTENEQANGLNAIGGSLVRDARLRLRGENVRSGLANPNLVAIQRITPAQIAANRSRNPLPPPRANTGIQTIQPVSLEQINENRRQRQEESQIFGGPQNQSGLLAIQPITAEQIAENRRRREAGEMPVRSHWGEGPITAPPGVAGLEAIQPMTLEQINRNHARGFANGGMVGSTDTVHAMLTPGEFVVNAGAAQKNLGLLHQINGYARGGVVSGGGGGGGELQAAINSFGSQINNFSSTASTLAQNLTSWVGASMELSKSLQGMPHSITMQGNHTHTVHITGAEALGRMTEGIKEMITNEIDEKLRKTFKDHFSEAAPLM